MQKSQLKLSATNDTCIQCITLLLFFASSFSSVHWIDYCLPVRYCLSVYFIFSSISNLLCLFLFVVCTDKLAHKHCSHIFFFVSCISVLLVWSEHSRGEQVSARTHTYVNTRYLWKLFDLLKFLGCTRLTYVHTHTINNQVRSRRMPK